MIGRVVSGLTLATLLAVGGIASTADVTAAPALPVAVFTPPDNRAMFVDASGMVALLRHAQVDMVLDGAHHAPPALASVRTRVDAVALTLPAGTR
jgi:hypothetical protein